MTLILVQLAVNPNQHATTIAEEKSRRLNTGDIVRVLKSRNDVGRRQYKPAWIAAGGSAGTYPMGFVVVEITDMTDTEAAELVKSYPETDDLDAVEFLRRWGFVAGGISAERQAELMTNGELVTNKALMQTALVDKAGLLTITDL